MKVAVLCLSDSVGGAAITSRRLTEALIRKGVDASLVVVRKGSDRPYVIKAPFPLRRRWTFLSERAGIYLANGFSRKNLFKIDTGAKGLPLWKIPAVKDADAVIINWVNQGMLSLKGVERLVRMGKRVIWTMHDMWNFTGICHHSFACRNFTRECGSCFLLGRRASPSDLSHRIWKKKKALYSSGKIKFVAVSSWLMTLARESSLLCNANLTLIPNAFPDVDRFLSSYPAVRHPFAIIFVAARLDDPIKGLDILRQGISAFRHLYPRIAGESVLRLVGDVKDPAALKGFEIETEYLGPIHDERLMAQAYMESAVVISTSLFENLPGTLVEGQAFGCIPVAFDRGGQRDIIQHQSTGFLVPWTDDETIRATDIADALNRALTHSDDIRPLMAESVRQKFSYDAVAKQYLTLLK